MFSGFDPGHRAYDWETWRYQGGVVRPASGERGVGAAPQAGAAGGPRRGARVRRRRRPSGAGHRRDAAAPAMRVPGPAAALRPVHAGDGRAGRRRAAGTVPQVCQRSRRTQAGRGPPRSCTALAGRSTPSASSTSAPRRSCRRCSATSAARAAASWPCAGMPPSRARPTSRPCSTCCPDTCPCRTRTRRDDLDGYVEAESVVKGFWANTGDYMVSLLKAWWGEAATADNDFCYDYLPRLTGSHSTYETVQAQLAAPARDTSCSGRTQRSARPTPACSGLAWRTWTGWWSGTWC